MKERKEELLKQAIEQKQYEVKKAEKAHPKPKPKPKPKTRRLTKHEKLAAEAAAFLGAAGVPSRRRGMIKGRAKRLSRMEKLRKVDQDLGINPASF